MRERQLRFIYGQLVRKGTVSYDIDETERIWLSDFNEEGKWEIGEDEHLDFVSNVSNWLENETTDYDCITEFIDK